MEKKISRYDVNRKIKSCLVSNNVDISEIHFSFSGKTAWFSGKILKVSGSEFSVLEIENICKEINLLSEIKFINFELDDWSISSGMGSFSIGRKTIAVSSSMVDKKPLVIDGDEIINDILKNQQSKIK